MKNAKKKNAPAPAPEPQPTIGQFIDSRLNAMALGGAFGGNFCLSPAQVAQGLVEDYVRRWPTVRYS